MFEITVFDDYDGAEIGTVDLPAVPQPGDVFEWDGFAMQAVSVTNVDTEYQTAAVDAKYVV